MKFEQTLATCLEALAQGATLEECLAQFPAQAEALRPLLELAITLRAHAKPQLTSTAFARGRRELAERARQAQATQNSSSVVVAGHRLPPATRRRKPARTVAPNLNHVAHSPYRLARGRAVQPKQSWLAHLPTLLITITLMLSLLTLLRQVSTSLPGSLFYPVKTASQRNVGILMTAAGEGERWQTRQVAQQLQELTRVQDESQALALRQQIDDEVALALRTSSEMPQDARVAFLQGWLEQLQQLETTLLTAPPAAPARLAALRRDALRQTLAAVRDEISTALNMAQPTATATPLFTATPVPTATATPAAATEALATVTPLLQATSTPTQVPVLKPNPLAPLPTAVLVPTKTPTHTATPVVVTPTAIATPLPEITVEIPLQASTGQKEEHSSANSDSSSNTESTADSSGSTATTSESSTADSTTVAENAGGSGQKDEPAQPALVGEVTASATEAIGTATPDSGTPDGETSGETSGEEMVATATAVLTPHSDETATAVLATATPDQAAMPSTPSEPVSPDASDIATEIPATAESFPTAATTSETGPGAESGVENTPQANPTATAADEAPTATSKPSKTPAPTATPQATATRARRTRTPTPASVVENTPMPSPQTPAPVVTDEAPPTPEVAPTAAATTAPEATPASDAGLDPTDHAAPTPVEQPTESD
ncbi:MAG: hypothetical protein R3C14_54470 [Caldilineaceae bacterium]